MLNTDSTELPLKAQQIVAAATTLFLEHGYGSVSMDAIAQAAQVSKPTLYSHFKDKAALFSEVMMAFCQQSNGHEVLQLFEGEGPVGEVLREVGQAQLKFVSSTDVLALVRIVFSESPRFPEIGKTFWDTGPQTFVEEMKKYLFKLNEQGTLNVADVSQAAGFYTSLLFWVQLFPILSGVTKRPSDQEIKAHVDYVVSEFLRRYQVDDAATETR